METLEKDVNECSVFEQFAIIYLFIEIFQLFHRVIHNLFTIFVDFLYHCMLDIQSDLAEWIPAQRKVT
jgi:hypothetical protein